MVDHQNSYLFYSVFLINHKNYPLASLFRPDTDRQNQKRLDARPSDRSGMLTMNW